MRSQWMLASVLALACASPPGAVDSGETSTESSETSNSSSTGGFPPDPLDLPESCDPWPQDCPEGEKCVPYASSGGVWDDNKCVPILGDHGPGEPCSYAGAIEATDDCDASSVCWNVIEVDGELVGTCQPFCTGTPDNPECPDDWYCQLYGDATKTICELRCDPVAQDCAAGLGCFWSGIEFFCVFTTQNIPAGEPCGYINDCAPGSFCGNPELLPSCAGLACCIPFCDVNLGDAQCDAVPGTVCLPIFERAPVGQEHIGYCGVP